MTGRSLVFTSPGHCEGLQQSCYVLDRQPKGIQAIQKVSGYTDDKCLIGEPMKGVILLDLVFTVFPNKETLVRDQKVESSCVCSYYKMVFIILRRGAKANNRISILDVIRADCGLFRDLSGKIPWDTVLERRLLFYFYGSGTIHPDKKEFKQTAGRLDG